MNKRMIQSAFFGDQHFENGRASNGNPGPMRFPATEARFDWTESLAAGPCLEDEFRTCGAVDEDHHSGFVAAVLL